MSLPKFLENTNITVTQTLNSPMITILEWDKTISIIQQLKISLIFLTTITKAWIKWKELTTSELFYSTQENSPMMIKSFWFQIKKEP